MDAAIAHAERQVLPVVRPPRAQNLTTDLVLRDTFGRGTPQPKIALRARRELVAAGVMCYHLDAIAMRIF